MKRRFWCVFLVCLLLLPSALSVLAADDYALKPVNAAYSGDAEEVYFYLYDYAGGFGRYQSYTLERLEQNRWGAVPVADQSKKANLRSTSGLKHPESIFVSAKIDAYRTGAGLPAGEYRIRAKYGDGPLYLPFTIVEGEAIAPASQFSAKTEYPAYDANVESIAVTISNQTENSVWTDTGFRLQRLDGTRWVTIGGEGQGGAGEELKLPVYWTDTAVFPLGGFDRPFQPGRYRAVRTFNMDRRVAAEFEILAPDACAKLEAPESAAVALFFPVRQSFSVQSGDLSAVWHGLLSFQKGTKPSVPGNAYAKITLTARAKKTVVDLYEKAGVIWAEIDGGWYFSDGVLGPEKLLALNPENAAPQTGPEMIRALNQLAPLKDVKFSPHNFSEPFYVPGWQSDRAVSGVTLSILQFTGEDMYAQTPVEALGRIRGEGYGVTQYSIEGEASIQTFRWAQPPHYFWAGGPLVVLYNGSDREILNALAGLFGPRIKTVEERAAEAESLSR